MARTKFLGGTIMLVVAFIAVFIVGAIVGIVVYTFCGLHVLNMTVDEASQCGSMLIRAGNNRESMIAVTIDNDVEYDYDSIRLEKR